MNDTEMNECPCMYNNNQWNGSFNGKTLYFPFRFGNFSGFSVYDAALLSSSNSNAPFILTRKHMNNKQ